MKQLLLTILLLCTATVFAEGKSTYMIPAGEILDRDVEIQMLRAKFSFKNKLAKLSYELPKVVDGPNPQRFNLVAKADSFPVKLSSDKVQAVCNKVISDISCVMKYSKYENGVFPLDLDGASLLIDQRTDLSLAEKQLLKQAGLALSHEALGIITIKK